MNTWSRRQWHKNGAGNNNEMLTIVKALKIEEERRGKENKKKKEHIMNKVWLVGLLAMEMWWVNRE